MLQHGSCRLETSKCFRCTAGVHDRQQRQQLCPRTREANTQRCWRGNRGHNADLQPFVFQLWSLQCNQEEVSAVQPLLIALQPAQLAFSQSNLNVSAPHLLEPPATNTMPSSDPTCSMCSSRNATSSQPTCSIQCK